MELNIEDKIFGRMQLSARVRVLIQRGYNLPEIEDDSEVCDICQQYFLDNELDHLYMVLRYGFKGKGWR